MRSNSDQALPHGRAPSDGPPGLLAAMQRAPGFALSLILHRFGRNARLRLFEWAFREPSWRGAIRAVRRDGFALIPQYLTPESVDFCLRVCEEAAERSEALAGDPYCIATAPGSLRLRHMESRHPEMDYFRRHLKIATLSTCLDGKPHWPSVQYSATYDGQCNPAFVDGRPEALFGGVCHVDQWHHQLKAVFLLDDVTPENGPLTVHPGTWRPQWQGFDTYRLKKWNKSNSGNPPDGLAYLGSDNFPAEVADAVQRRVPATPLTGKAGDLILFDSRTLHFAGKIEKGRRRLLWFYF